MLDELHVQNVALIKDATLLPSRGLTVITGETGAGKTALLSALKLLVGDRADVAYVRDGASGLAVEGRFCPRDESIHEQGISSAKQHPIDFEHGESSDDVSVSPLEDYVVSRTLTVQGRSRVHIDGHIAGVGQLARLVGTSVDLCGQHEHQRLMQPANHRRMLDRWAQHDLSQAQTEWSQAYDRAQQAARELEAVREAGELSEDALERARFILKRINEVSPAPQEYEELQMRLPVLEHAESLMHQVEGARAALSDDNGALDTIGHAVSLLEDSQSIDSTLEDVTQSLREALFIVEDVARDVRKYVDDIDIDMDDLIGMQDRMGQLQDLIRSWGPTMDEVFAARDKAQEILDASEGFEERLAAAQIRVDEAEQILLKAAHAFHEARELAAPRFCEAVQAHMDRLELGGARLTCAVTLFPREKWTQSGPDGVEFLFCPGSASTPRPLAKIASGGEASRVMLAIKVALGNSDEVETLVFDEVDAGVGGTVARALAAVLFDLAETHQVIVVTHLAQVAVMAETHYVVHKTLADIPETTLCQVEGDERAAEIARMLSGDTSATALAHARRLLEEAHQVS